MSPYWRFILVHLFALHFVVGTAPTLQAGEPRFNRLDSLFQANAGIYSQEKMKKLLFELRSLGGTPLEKGKIEMCNSIFHLRGARLGLALIANEKAEQIFDSLGNSDLALQTRLIGIDICHRLRDRGKIDTLLARVRRTHREFRGDQLDTQVLRILGASHLNRGQLDSAHTYFEKANILALNRQDSSESCRILYLNAIAYQLQGKPKKALEIMRALEQQVFQVPDYAFQANFLSIMGMVYMSVGQNDEAVSSYEKGVELTREHNLYFEQGGLLSSLAIGLKAAGDTLRAIDAFKEALEIAMDLNQWANISSICSGLADIHIGLKNWAVAETYAQKGLDYSRKAHAIRMESYALMRLAMAQIPQGGYRSALQHLSLADSLTRPTGNWARIRMINELRAEASEHLGEMDQALSYQRMASAAQDSIEILEAKKYADSLKLSQPLIVVSESDTQETPDSKTWIWAVVAIAAIGLAIGLYFALRPKNRPTPEPEPSAAAEMDSVSIAEAMQSLRANKDWTQFMLQFDTIYPGLTNDLVRRHPEITPTDLRILVLARLGLSTDEAADLLGISPDSVKKARYRTRKRLGIPPEQSLLQYMLQD